MVVSPGLQKYFAGKKKKKWDVDDKLSALSGDIDPRFMQSFVAFRERILDIVEEDPTTQDMVHEELSDLEMSLSRSARQHNLKKASVVKEATKNI